MKGLPNQMNLYRKTLDRCTVSDEKAQEILDEIVARKDKAQNSEPDQNKKTIRRYVSVAAAACVALAIIIAGVQVSQHGGLPGLSPVPVVEQSSQSAASEQPKPVESSAVETPSETSPIDKTEPETPTVVVPPTPNGKFYWNNIRSGGATMMYKDPDAVARQVSFSEFCNILGYDPTPTYIPQGFEVTSQKVSTFYVNPDGSWADYYSFFALGCTKGQDDITIYVAPAGVEVYANNDVPMDSQELQASTFDGFEATLMKNNPTPEEIEADRQAGISSFDLSAVFQIRGNNYYAYTRGNVPADEFVKVIQSLY